MLSVSSMSTHRQSHPSFSIRQPHLSFTNAPIESADRLASLKGPPLLHAPSSAEKPYHFETSHNLERLPVINEKDPQQVLSKRNRGPSYAPLPLVPPLMKPSHSCFNRKTKILAPASRSLNIALSSQDRYYSLPSPWPG